MKDIEMKLKLLEKIQNQEFEKTWNFLKEVAQPHQLLMKEDFRNMFHLGFTSGIRFMKKYESLKENK